MVTLQPAWNFYLERVGFETKLNMRRNLKNGDNIVGRKGTADVDIDVDSNQCSAKHCMIMVSEDLVVVKNLNTSNGTTVNGTKINKDMIVKVDVNDLIGIVDGFRPNSELIGNFNYVVYRLCKYSSDNLPTIEIDDDDIIEVEDNSDNEGVIDASNADESINLNEGLELGMHISKNFNIELKEKLQDDDVDELMDFCRDLTIASANDFGVERLSNEIINVETISEVDDVHTANTTAVNNNSSQYPHSSNIDTSKACCSKDIRWENDSNVDGLNDKMCFAPTYPKEIVVSSNEVSNDSCTSSTAIEVDDGIEEICNISTDPSVNVHDKLKETVTKLTCNAKKKRGLEIIVAKPLATRRKTIFEDPSTPSSRKPPTQCVTKEERNERLRKLVTKKTNDLIENREKRRTTVKAKVTVNNRGSFLTDTSQIPILPGQRKIFNKKPSGSHT